MLALFIKLYILSIYFYPTVYDKIDINDIYIALRAYKISMDILV